jgi:hypothetical protein
MKLLAGEPGLDIPVFANLAEGAGQSLSQLTGRGRREVGDQTMTGPADLLQSQFDPNVLAAFAVVHDRHGPGQLRALRVVGWVVVAAVVSELFHLLESSTA